MRNYTRILSLILVMFGYSMNNYSISSEQFPNKRNAFNRKQINELKNKMNTDKIMNLDKETLMQRDKGNAELKNIIRKVIGLQTIVKQDIEHINKNYSFVLDNVIINKYFNELKQVFEDLITELTNITQYKLSNDSNNIKISENNVMNMIKKCKEIITNINKYLENNKEINYGVLQIIIGYSMFWENVFNRIVDNYNRIKSGFEIIENNHNNLQVPNKTAIDKIIDKLDRSYNEVTNDIKRIKNDIKTSKTLNKDNINFLNQYLEDQCCQLNRILQEIKNINNDKNRMNMVNTKYYIGLMLDLYSYHLININNLFINGGIGIIDSISKESQNELNASAVWSKHWVKMFNKYIYGKI